MASISLAEVLEMPAVRAARPRVLAGEVTGAVSWVHTTELADIGRLLRTGDLVLTTGIALPDSADELARFVVGMHENGAAGLLVELGRRWDELPTSLVEGCRKVGLPLVALTREIRFAAVAQAVGERIVDRQLADLRDAERVHETFAELSISEAGPAEILEATQRLSGAAIVLESEDRRVLDYRAGPSDVAAFLAEWTERSRQVDLPDRTAWDEGNGWLVTRLGRRERGWGRLVLEAPDQPSHRMIAIAERAAAALAMHRLHDRQRDSLTRRVHHELLVRILADSADPEIHRRCELAGVPLRRRQLVGLALRVPDSTARSGSGAPEDDVLAALLHAAAGMRAPLLAAGVDREVRALLSLAPSTKADEVVDRLARRVSRRMPVVVAAGHPVTRPELADVTLRGALHVLDAVRDPNARHVHRLEDTHLRGLLVMLGSDERLRAYVGRELRPLRDHDERHGTRLLDVLAALLRHPTSKAAAADELHFSRPAFYNRLDQAERILGRDLADPEVRVSLHVALLAADLMNSPNGASRIVGP
jgi:purine catabolism regulator